MEDLKPALYDWCAEENHLDLQIADDDDFSKPHLWLRFLEDPMEFNKWYAIELRHLNEEIDSHKVQHFVHTLPEKHTIVEKIMVSKEGFTQAAIVLAGQHGVRCLNFAKDDKDYYGYLVPVVSSQTVDSPDVLSQREWQQIHTRLEDSRRKGAAVKAVISDPNSDQSYTWDSLEGALPIVTPYETTSTHAYEFPKHRLLVTGFDPLPIERVKFKYFTTFRILDGREEGEALAELLELVVFG
jgi:hypothetical protein